MALRSKLFAGILLIIILISFPSKTRSESENNNTTTTTTKCGSNSDQQGCRNNKNEALKLKLVAIFSILVTSIIGVSLPLFSRTIPSLQPDTNLFVLVKAFASGVILATGYMHVLPDSFYCLTSECLPENPWRKFPFTTFVAMLSAILTLSVDSYAMSYFKKKKLERGDGSINVGDYYAQNNDKMESQNSHVHGKVIKCDDKASQLLRYRVVAQVLELGIIVHSVVIGLSMGASDNPCTIRPLVAAICFHQLFEGMGLGGCILQADYGMRMKSMLVLFFSITTPFGIALGIGLSNVYSENSPTSLIVVGLLNACSAGLLNYMALVDLLASDFMGTKLQNNMKLQPWAYLAVLLGAGGMSVMAIWA